MRTQEELTQKFQIEELEHRYEMGWVDEVVVGADYEGVGVKVTIPVN